MQFNREESVFKPDFFVKKNKDCPKTAILTWQDGFAKIAEQIPNKLLTIFRSCGKVSVKSLDFGEDRLAFLQIPSSSPMVAQAMEELKVLGVENIVFIGSCGILDNECNGNFIVPSKALRDEGTSWHYIESQDEFIVCKNSEKVSKILFNLNIPNIVRPVWTTDTIYRETKTAVKYAKEKGCCAVDMECSAINAVADYLNLNVYQVFYTADSLANKEWDVGKLTKIEAGEYQVYFDIAKQIALEIDKE